VIHISEPTAAKARLKRKKAAGVTDKKEFKNQRCRTLKIFTL
jgi:hypothetical protein